MRQRLIIINILFQNKYLDKIMDFTSEIFPGYKLHITLYKFSDATTD